MSTDREQPSEETSSLLRFFSKRPPKSEGVFFSQIIILYIVVITCIVNLSLANGNSNLWTALLSSSLGYMLPTPSLKTQKPLTTTTTL
jgi:hypothetical protein